MKLRTRVTQWPDPWGFGIYGQQWRSHWQATVALFWWSFIFEFRGASQEKR